MVCPQNHQLADISTGILNYTLKFGVTSSGAARFESANNLQLPFFPISVLNHS
jgi:hypothetical protein